MKLKDSIKRLLYGRLYVRPVVNSGYTFGGGSQDEVYPSGGEVKGQGGRSN